MSTFKTDPEEQVLRFKKFLQIKSISYEGPLTGSYKESVDYLNSLFTSIGLKTRILTYVPNKPILLATWEGSQPSLPSILLNSHYDVVPVVLDKWTFDPFLAHEDEEGYIFARGTQDMKSVCMQYIEAIALLVKRGFTPIRTIHLTFVPDEEIGGVGGMQKLAPDSAFTELNVGVALDEGLANPTEKFTVFNAERQPAWLVLRSRSGPTDLPTARTATDKLFDAVNKFLEYRAQQEAVFSWYDNGSPLNTYFLLS
eukprot:TRINITY_DN1923_c0_g1_i2.p1 TRINITY_DN1923_c0_g1~~TRINITY_DN1923_c0_g1_i2.p1  ORF type:complete len:255 (+),score=48.70 TRINITY_DN1923_c0_g1_i2:3-767(+)